MRQKISELLDVVKKVEKDSREAAGKSSEAANEASGGLTASYSAAGDAEHARNTANLSIQKHQSIKKLKEELEKFININSPNKVTPACYVEMELGQNGVKEIFLVENLVFISGFNLISPESELGKVILGKNLGDTFSYETNEQVVNGKILDIG